MKTHKGMKVIVVTEATTLAEFQKMCKYVTEETLAPLLALYTKWMGRGAEKVVFGTDSYTGMGVMRMIKYRHIGMDFKYVSREGSLI